MKFNLSKIFHYFTETIGWIQLFLSPFLLSIILAFLVHHNVKSTTGLFLSIGILIIGFILGIYMATKIWKKTGTISFLSRISETPDINEK
jgi:F0F1-type ATP synthase assembly protein I